MPELRPGDIFCTVNPMWLGRAICAIESFWDPDGRAEYSHSGIILGPNGTTFEALWRNQRQGLFSAHGGKKVVIGRHEAMTKEAFAAGWSKVSHLEGRRYAGHRLLLNLIPPFAKYIATGRYAVCSEVAAKFLAGAGLLDHWKGVTPDYLAGILRRWRCWETVFEGDLPATLEEFNRAEVPHVGPRLQVV